jgi:hypothetical protein
MLHWGIFDETQAFLCGYVSIALKRGNIETGHGHLSLFLPFVLCSSLFSCDLDTLTGTGHNFWLALFRAYEGTLRALYQPMYPV